MNLIIDGNNIAFRAFSTKAPPKLVQGVDVAPVDRFFAIILDYLKHFKPDQTYITWDKNQNPDPKATNFRKKAVDYKGKRDPEKRKAVHAMIDVIDEGLKYLGVKTMLPWNLEADDIIAYLVRTLNEPSVIVSSDGDLLQLVSENTTVFAHHKNIDVTPYNFEDFTNGVSINRFVLFKSIKGDSSDGIPGLKGYGDVKSRRLVNDIDALKKLNKSQRAILKRNVELMDLEIGIHKSKGEEEFYKIQLRELPKANLEQFHEYSIDWDLSDVLGNYNEWVNVVIPPKQQVLDLYAKLGIK